MPGLAIDGAVVPLRDAAAPAERAGAEAHPGALYDPRMERVRGSHARA